MEVSYFQWLLLGLVQGIFEWLPVSSEAMLVLTQSYLGLNGGLADMIGISLFLHLGTWFAALVYLYAEVKKLVFAVFNWNTASKLVKIEVRFLVLSSVVTAIIGGGLLLVVKAYESEIEFTGKGVMLLIGSLLVVTGILQLFSKKIFLLKRSMNEFNIYDSLIAGFAQGLAILPGFSRSGLTISSLLYRRVDKLLAIRLSFLMSLPVVLGGNIVVNYKMFFDWSAEYLIGLVSSFIFGMLTIHSLLWLTRRVNFGVFVIVMGIFMCIAGMV